MNVAEEIDRGTARAAVALAARAPSVHNSQPWRWWIGERVVHLYADMGRWLPLTDTDGRDLMISCGAALHHLRVALAALGVAATVDRLPDPDRPELLAAVELRPGPGPREPGVDPAEVSAVAARRTDRRRYGTWPVPDDVLDHLAARAADHGALLRVVSDPAHRRALALAAQTAAADHAGTRGYATELSLWSGLHSSDDGVPAANVPPPVRHRGGVPPRRFAGGDLTDPSGEGEDGAALLVLGTSSDDLLSQLRAGEATSAVLLHATAIGLATCPLSEPLEVEGTRGLLRDQVLGGSVSPQLVLRVGWAPSGAEPVPPTPRRALADQVDLAPPAWW